MEAKSCTTEPSMGAEKVRDDVKKQKEKSVIVREALIRCFWHCKVAGFVLFLACVAVPIFLKANSWIVPKVIFSTIVRWPPFINLACPSDFGLNATRNFYFDVEEGIHVGAWHILPESLAAEGDRPWEAYEETLLSGKNIFLYLHGNSGTRGGHHRVQMYKFLSKHLDAHVLTIDYRGYGDSSGSPTVEGVVKDAHFAYKWLKEKSNGAPVFLWGHSLGTGITTKLAHELCAEGDPPMGVILESPFNNIVDAAHNHPFAYPFKVIPGFMEFITESIKEHDVHLSSDHYISEVTPHILILHAEDDLVVPFHLGEKLYQQAKKTRSQHTKDVELVAFQGHYGYGHKHICKAPELPDIVRNFVEKAYADIKN